jgi:hypothetical protein
MLTSSKAALVLSFIPAMAFAAAPRTFVSAASGSDSNPCTRALPCRSFAAAMLVTNPAGEVVAIDSGGYGSIAINQGVTIVAPTGVHAAITASGPDAVTINAGLSDGVVLRGLAISGPGVAGIHANTFKQLFVESCTIDNFANYGVNVDITYDGAKIYVRDTIVRRAGTAGIALGTQDGTVWGWISKSRFDEGGNIGVFASYGANIVCHDCEANDNVQVGYRVFAHGGVGLDGQFAELNCENCVASGNGVGFYVEGQVQELATLRLSRSFVTGNTVGVQESMTAAVWVLSGTNLIHGNGTDKVGTFDPVPNDNP